MGEAACVIRYWRPDDDSGLRRLMEEQHKIDPAWPPEYAWHDDLADWLSLGTELGRWIACDQAGEIVGHAGIGRPKPGRPRELLCDALGCGVEDLAEISRVVVCPTTRGQGLSGRLTKTCLRAAIENGWYPVASVSSSRGSWLEMMVDTGWQVVARTPSQVTDNEVITLLPPERFVRMVRQSI